jgi:hypothetical protein
LVFHVVLSCNPFTSKYESIRTIRIKFNWQLLQTDQIITWCHQRYLKACLHYQTLFRHFFKLMCFCLHRSWFERCFDWSIQNQSLLKYLEILYGFLFHQTSLTKFLMEVYTVKELCQRKLSPSFWWKTLIV